MAEPNDHRTGTESKSLDELYQMWNDSQSYIADQNQDILAQVEKLNKNLSKLLEILKGQKDG